MNPNMFQKMSYKSLIALPLYILPFALISGPLIPEIIIVLLTFIFIFNGKNYCDKKLLKLLILFFASVLFSTLISNYTYLEENNSFNIIKSLFHYRFIFLFLFTIFILKKERSEKIFTYLLIVVIFFLCFDTLIQYFYGNDILGNPKSAIGRLSGPYNQEYIIGGVILKFYLIYFCLNFEKIFYFNKHLIFFLIISNIAFFSIIISGERSTFVLFLILLVCNLIYFFLFKKKTFFAFFLSLIICLPIYIKNSDLMINRIQDLSNDFKEYTQKKDEQNYNNNFRQSYGNDVKFKIFNRGYYAHYFSSIEILKDNILFGVGQRNFRYACKDIKESKNTIDFLDNNSFIERENFLKNICTTHPHNTYMELLSETGLIGTFLFITLIAILFKRILKSRRYYLITPWLIIFFPLVPTGSFFNNFNSMFIYLIVAVIYFKTTDKKFFSVHKSSQLSY